MTGFGIALTVAGRIWSLIFLGIVLGFVVAWAYGTVFDWRQRRRDRAIVRERVAELTQGVYDQAEQVGRPFVPVVIDLAAEIRELHTWLSDFEDKGGWYR